MIRELIRQGAATVATLFFLGLSASAQEPQVIEMQPPPGMELAQILIAAEEPNPAGVLVLLSGHNESPAKFLADPKWRELAARHRFALLGCYFKNDMTAKSGFYQFPAHGAGKVLTDAIRKRFKKDLPIALFGLSAGGQFTARFAALNPRQVKVWAAYAPGSVDSLRPGPALPPGLILCGGNDTTRLGAVEGYFRQGRSLGYRWLWAAVPNNGHSAAPEAVSFIQSFFDAALSARTGNAGAWINLADGLPATGGVTRKPAFGWLPDAKLAAEWKTLCGK